METGTIKKLFNLRQGDEFILSDEKFKTIFPRVAGKKLIASVLKNSGQRMFLQYNGEIGCGTIKIPFSSPTIECEVTVLGKSESMTLAQFMVKERGYSRFYDNSRVKNLKLNVNGRSGFYVLEYGFMEQNPTNIFAKKMKHHGMSYRVPTSSIVLEVNEMKVEDYLKTIK